DRWFGQAVPGFPHRFRLQAKGEDFSIDLVVDSQKPPVVHGVDGVSRKGQASGETSHYYSLTRL
ncbi:MAG: carotenoid 1,2-hydratase, partial [Nitrospira sp.]|nr:carotenoid 1,2-hydratase [Nitrospira sp.]